MVGGINPPPFNGGISLSGNCYSLPGNFPDSKTHTTLCSVDKTPFFLNVPSITKKNFGKFSRNME